MTDEISQRLYRPQLTKRNQIKFDYFSPEDNSFIIMIRSTGHSISPEEYHVIYEDPHFTHHKILTAGQILETYDIVI